MCYYSNLYNKRSNMMTAATNLFFDTPVRLVNILKNTNVVTFANGLQGRASFSIQYKHLEIIMKTIGIDVPEGERANYSFVGEKRRIKLEDKNFGKAFYEIYYKRSMNPTDFQWKPLK